MSRGPPTRHFSKHLTHTKHQYMQVLQRQRKDGDCGINALVNYLHIPYEDIYVVALQVQPKSPRKGLLMREMLEIARRLQRPLRAKRNPDLDADSGVLGVLWGPKGKDKGGHWVMLSEGRIIDGDPIVSVWTADEYLATFKGRPGFLLTEDTD